MYLHTFVQSVNWSIKTILEKFRILLIVPAFIPSIEPYEMFIASATFWTVTCMSPQVSSSACFQYVSVTDVVSQRFLIYLLFPFPNFNQNFRLLMSIIAFAEIFFKQLLISLGAQPSFARNVKDAAWCVLLIG